MRVEVESSPRNATTDPTAFTQYILVRTDHPVFLKADIWVGQDGNPYLRLVPLLAEDLGDG